MGKCPEPNDENIGNGVVLAFSLNVAINLMREAGFGLPLVNALAERFPDLSQSNIGSLASLAGEGVRAGTLLTDEQMGNPVNPAGLPIVPADFHPGESGDRIIAGVDVTGFDTRTGTDTTHRIWVNGDELMTPEDFRREAERIFGERMDKYKEQQPAPVPGILGSIVDFLKEIWTRIVFFAGRF